MVIIVALEQEKRMNIAKVKYCNKYCQQSMRMPLGAWASRPRLMRTPSPFRVR